MTPNKVVLFSMLLMPFFVVQVTPLKCFRCNSNENPECFRVRPLAKLDAMTSPKVTVTNSSTTTITTTTTTVAPTNSSKLLKESAALFLEECSPDDKGREPFCRKMVYTVLNNKHHRVVRECGYERSPKDCYMADNDDHLEMVCQCWTDGCNRVERAKLSSIVAINVAFAVLIRLFNI